MARPCPPWVLHKQGAYTWHFDRCATPSRMVDVPSTRQDYISTSHRGGVAHHPKCHSLFQSAIIPTMRLLNAALSWVIQKCDLSEVCQRHGNVTYQPRLYLCQLQKEAITHPLFFLISSTLQRKFRHNSENFSCY